MAAATRRNTIGHWTIRQVQANAGPRLSQLAIGSASVGPTRTSANDTRMKIPTAKVRPIAISLTFHHGRLSVISYALFIVLMIPDIALDVDQTVPRKPMVSSPPFLLPAIFATWSLTIVNTSPGANRDSAPTTWFMRSWTGKKLARATRNSSAGKRARKK